METINLQWLQDHGACAPARKAFRKRWGDADVPLSDVLLALTEHPEGPDWFAWLSCWKQGTFYRVFRQYRTAVLPLDEQYLIAIKPLFEQRNAALDRLLEHYAKRELTVEQYVDAYDSICERYKTVVKPFQQQLNTARREVLRKLADGLTEVGATP